MDISKIDKNFLVKDEVTSRDDIDFYSIDNAPFEIFGVKRYSPDDEKYRRMPEDVAMSVSEGVHGLHANTAGGRVRFRTDSPIVAISAELYGIGKMPHFALTGSAGFDLYRENDDGAEIYIGTFVPPCKVESGYSSMLWTGDGMRDYTINMPLYTDVKKLYIGIQKGAALTAHEKNYRDIPTIAYYGSSITQGGCASRPGNAYQSIISRRFNVDHINLGFSGNAKAEQEITDYINGLDMSIFVYDYDHNAPTVEHLEETHEKMFLQIREKHPNLPVIMVTRPSIVLNEDTLTRRDIIYKTYENSVKAGDKNTYFINGYDLVKDYGDCGTVDTCHPNDCGFYGMAKGIGDVIEKILAK